MVRYRIFVVFFFMVCGLATGSVGAGQGHHGQTVCDEADLIGAAYGTCHTYCEALNCDGPHNSRHDRACDRALDRFFDLTGELPPCEPLCPCASGWLNPEFQPSDIVATDCYVQVTDQGTLVDLRLEGGPDENGEGALSAAGFNIFDDEDAGYHGFGCFSEHYADGTFTLSEDSGTFEMSTSFRNESDLFDRQQNEMFTSCKTVLKKIVQQTGAECVVDDTRSQ